MLKRELRIVNEEKNHGWTLLNTDAEFWIYEWEEKNRKGAKCVEARRG